jgi:hypothetical protein
LGSFLTTGLSDDQDITVRIRKATQQQVEGSTNFFVSKAADLFTKKMIFLAILVSTILHGCESWALKAQHINKLQVFFHRLIRHILGINMQRVEHDRVKNECASLFLPQYLRRRIFDAFLFSLFSIAIILYHVSLLHLSPKC